MAIAVFLGGYEGLLIILILGIPILIGFYVVKEIKKRNNSINEISENQKVIIRKLEEQENTQTD